MPLFLSESEVAHALAAIDPVEAVAAALAAHARGDTVLPHEAYLAWTHAGDSLRSLSMPGVVDGRPGVKIINANPANPDRGLPRASGLLVLFDHASARPACVMDAARISCLRTAAVTALAADTLGVKPLERVAIIGAGALARCHLELLLKRLPTLHEIRIHDRDPTRAANLLADAHNAPQGSDPSGALLADACNAKQGSDPCFALVADAWKLCGSAEEAIRGAQLVVTVTTTTTGYIRHEWLEPGALLVNVSLDDALPEVYLRADRLVVDDWDLIAADGRRLLGRMLRGGEVDRSHATLGEVLIGARAGRSGSGEIIVVNPFGLAIEDIAVADRVYHHAVGHTGPRRDHDARTA